MKTFSILSGGDVMVGRGIDQIFKTSSDPVLFESFVKDARKYIELANSKLFGDATKTKKVQVSLKQNHGYLWEKFNPGKEKEKRGTRVLVANLETSITTAMKPWPRKGIHYRMHPENAPVLVQGGFDVLSLANNHVCDFGREGLLETLQILENHKIKTIGAGKTLQEAQKPAIFLQESPKNKAIESVLMVFAFAHSSSGVPEEWQATNTRSGVWILFDLNEKDFKQIVQVVETEKSAICKSKNIKKSQILVMFMVHWLPNWVENLSEYPKITNFAHRLTDELNVHLIHSTSTHHALPPEIRNGSIIIYGSGDLVNDYEGIAKSKTDESGFHSECGFFYETIWKEVKKKEIPKEIKEKEENGWKMQKAQAIPVQMHAFQLIKAESKSICTQMCEKWTRQGGIFC